MLSRLSILAFAGVFLLAACEATESPLAVDEVSAPSFLLPDGTFNPDFSNPDLNPTFPERSGEETGTIAFSGHAINLVVNGDFEIGNSHGSTAIPGWTHVQFGNGGVRGQAGTRSPISGWTVQSPPSGNFAAMSDQTGPGTQIIYQDVEIPSSGATLSFELFIGNRSGVWFSPATLSHQQTNQQFRMDVVSTGANLLSTTQGVLLNVYHATAGHPLISGYRTVTASLNAFAGQTVRLRFATVETQFFFQAGIDNVQVVGTPDPVDATPPVIEATVSGTLGDNGWYTSDVNVSWTVTDDESAVSSSVGCGTTNVTADTNGVTFTCTATSAGGTASESVTIKRDATAPTIAVALGGTLHNGWYNTDVTVDWTAADNLSGIASDTCADNTVTGDGDPISQECTVTDNAGNSATGTTGEFKRDATDPTVTYSGNAGSYDVAGFVGITCAATDNLSGIASDTCADLSGAAYTFGLGTTSFSASAEDVAGNTGSASGSFEVTASLDGLCTLVQRFVSHRGIANSLCAKTSAAERARNDSAHDGALGAFINEVQAQSGKKIDAADALVLIAIANALIG